MTTEEVRARVSTIAVLAQRDYEAAHAEEDRLYVEVLRHLAEQGSELAAEALKTQDLDFDRYCA